MSGSSGSGSSGSALIQLVFQKTDGNSSTPSNLVAMGKRALICFEKTRPEGGLVLYDDISVSRVGDMFRDPRASENEEFRGKLEHSLLLNLNYRAEEILHDKTGHVEPLLRLCLHEDGCNYKLWKNPEDIRMFKDRKPGSVPLDCESGDPYVDEIKDLLKIPGEERDLSWCIVLQNMVHAADIISGFDASQEELKRPAERWMQTTGGGCVPSEVVSLVVKHLEQLSSDGDTEELMKMYECYRSNATGGFLAMNDQAVTTTFLSLEMVLRMFISNGVNPILLGTLKDLKDCLAMLIKGLGFNREHAASMHKLMNIPPPSEREPRFYDRILFHINIRLVCGILRDLLDPEDIEHMPSFFFDIIICEAVYLAINGIGSRKRQLHEAAKSAFTWSSMSGGNGTMAMASAAKAMLSQVGRKRGRALSSDADVVTGLRDRRLLDIITKLVNVACMLSSNANSQDEVSGMISLIHDMVQKRIEVVRANPAMDKKDLARNPDSFVPANMSHGMDEGVVLYAVKALNALKTNLTDGGTSNAVVFSHSQELVRLSMINSMRAFNQHVANKEIATERRKAIADSKKSGSGDSVLKRQCLGILSSLGGGVVRTFGSLLGRDAAGSGVAGESAPVDGHSGEEDLSGDE